MTDTANVAQTIWLPARYSACPFCSSNVADAVWHVCQTCIDALWEASAVRYWAARNLRTEAT